MSESSKLFPGAVDFMKQLTRSDPLTSNEECISLSGKLYRDKPELWNEDIGE